jgi:N-acylneuraminate cytidylyltransferase
MKWIALMPLRGGSKSIPNKNIRNLAGRPLYEWSLEQAVFSKCFDEIVAASDSKTIRETVANRFADAVTVIERSAASATDSASSETIMLEVQQRIDFDVMCLIQATSPLTKAEDFVQAKEKFMSGSYDSLLTAVPFNRFLWDDHERPINYDPAQRPRRQDSAAQYMENGAFYFTTTKLLESSGCRLGGRIGIYVMSTDSACEIDEPRDWDTVEQLLLGAGTTKLQHMLGDIKALVVDVDGTLTDGGMYYGADGEALKKFHTRDGKGLERLAEQGVRICVISAEDSSAMAARIRKLGISEYHAGVEDKITLLKNRANVWGVQLDRIAVIGDDLGDLDLIEQAGVSFCPADAVAEVRTRVDYVCHAKGGRGAVRETCDLIYAANQTRNRQHEHASSLPPTASGDV